jgi:Methyltransferase domain
MSSVDQLLQAEIGIHTELRGGTEVTAGIGEEVLRWLEKELQPDMQTAEIGCGLTTVIFASSGTSHLCVSPFADEHQRVTDWCGEQNIDVSRVRFVPERSDVALPGLGIPKIDFALIDGSHAFPHAFVDFWYLALPLTVGGVLVIDDVQIWTGRVLCDFLSEQPGWELLRRWDKTVAFRKTAPVDEKGAWTRQPYVRARSLAPDLQGLKGYIDMIRHGEYAWAAKRARGFVARKLG